MKKLFIIFLLLIINLLDNKADAQTWSTRVSPESFLGAGGGTVSSSRLLTVNGNPAIACRDGSHNKVIYARSTDASGTNWESPIYLDINGHASGSVSMEIVNGNPAVSYYDPIAQHLKFVRADDASGTTWGAPVSVVDVTGNAGLRFSMQVVNGNPAIAYDDQVGGALKYVCATDASGTSWGTPVIAATPNPGSVSLLVVNGNPAIAYSSSGLKYVRASNVSGSSWNTPTSVVSSISVTDVSMQVVNGVPAIVFNDLTNSYVKYIRANDASGSNWSGSSGTPVVNSGGTPSLLVVSGNPAISYEDRLTSLLRYVRATDINGSTWGTPITLDGTPTVSAVGALSCLQIINGNPAISYNDQTNGSIKYRRSTTTTGATWGTISPAITPIVTVNAATGRHNSSAVINGNPAVSYYGIQNLRYVRATNAFGSAWNTPVTIDITGNVGEYTSLKEVNGNPAIAYYDVTNGDLKYVRATDVSGTTWGTPIVVESSGDVGAYTCLKIVNGNPAIAYYDVTNGDLKYVRATDVSGTAWGTPIVVESSGDVGTYPSLEVINGNPAIAYRDVTNSDLKYIRATDASGTTWDTPVVLDAAGSLGNHISLVVADGNPAIAYRDITNQDLKYIRANDASGTTWNTSLTLDATGNVGNYAKLAIVNGKPSVVYCDNTVQRIKYITATDASGTNWNAPTTLITNADSGLEEKQFLSLLAIGTDVGVFYYERQDGIPYFIHGTNTICTNPSIPTINASSTTHCGTQSTTLSITAGDLYDATNWQWYSGTCGGTAVGTGTSVTVSPSETTIYFARGEGGCVTPGACAAVTITVHTLPSVSFDALNNVCSNVSSVILSGGSPSGGTYSGTGVSSGSFSPVTAGNGVHTITYSYTDANSCSNTANSDIMVNICTSVEKESVANKFHVYPNPTEGLVSISYHESGTLEIYDAWGTLVNSYEFSGTPSEYNMQYMGKGLYTFKLYHGKDISIQKVIVQ